MSTKSPALSAARRILYTSPWPPLFFLAVFAVFIIGQFIRLPRFIYLNHTVLLLNNLCFLALIGARFFWYFLRRSKNIRYDVGDRPKRGGAVQSAGRDTLRAELGAAGFQFDGNGYGEKKTLSYTAMILLYGGLFLALLVGSYDNMRQVSGALFQGVGNPISLADENNYLKVTKGPLASLKGLPRFQIRKQILPNAEWPKGAIDLVLLDANDAVLTQTTMGRYDKPLVYNGYQYHFSRFLYDFILEIGTSNNHIEFSDSLKFMPLDTPRGSYTHFARFGGERLFWVALLDPSRLAIKLYGSAKDKKTEEAEIVFRKDNVVTFGNYDVRIGGMTHWSEIHVVRPRHMVPIYIGGVIALIGLILRLLFQPQRVWLEETPEGCRAWATGGEAKKLVKAEGLS